MDYAISMICGAFLALVLGGRRYICPPLPTPPEGVKPPPPPCPPLIWKDYLTMLGGALGAFLYIILMKVNPTFTSLDFMASIFAAVAVGGMLARGLCPIE